MTRFHKLFLLAILALAAPVTLAACGGDDVDPEQVLRETFGNDEKVSSGVIDITLSGAVEGEQAGSGELSISGPFQSDPEDPDAMPQFDLTGSIDGEAQGTSIGFEGALAVTEDNAYVTYQGQSYELGTDIFASFRDLVEQAAAQAQAGATGEEGASQSFDQQCRTLIEQGGGNADACDTLDIFSWFDLSHEGTQEVGGAETDHIHGVVDIPSMVDNINATIEAAEIEGATPISEEDASEAEAAVSELTFDVFSGVDDRLLYGFDLNLAVDPTAIEDADTEGVESVTADFSSRLSAVNEEQTIDAPTDAQPISDLLGQFGISEEQIQQALQQTSPFGLGGGLGGTELDSDLGGGTGDTGGAGAGGGGAGGGGGTSPEDIEAANEFFDCIAKAETPEELEACNALAP